MEKFAQGDLRVQVSPQNSKDDIGKLFIGFNHAVKNINQMIIGVTKAIKAVMLK